MKRGDNIKVTFTGKLAMAPIKSGDEYFLRVKVDGKPGWIAIVPLDSAELIGDDV